MFKQVSLRAWGCVLNFFKLRSKFANDKTLFKEGQVHSFGNFKMKFTGYVYGFETWESI